MYAELLTLAISLLVTPHRPRCILPAAGGIRKKDGAPSLLHKEMGYPWGFDSCKHCAARFPIWGRLTCGKGFPGWFVMARKGYPEGLTGLNGGA